VINDHQNVNQQTRAHVQEVIQQLNFHPNRAARRLAGGRTRVLGLVIPAEISRLFNDPYFSILIQGVTAFCTDQDYSVMLWLAEPTYERRMIGQILHNGLIDGLIVSSFISNDPIVRSLTSGALPYVLIGRSLHQENAWCIDVDNIASANHAVEYLISKGRRRIAHISGPRNTLVSEDRANGYRAALKKYNLSEDRKLMVEGDFSEVSGYLAVKKLLQQHPDAIFAASDAMALGALRAILEAGFIIPDDIAVIGFDDIPMAAHAIPPLTTIHQPIQEMGAAASELLITQIENPPSAPCQNILPTRLVLRSSA